jgi:hypothetical protein
MTGYEKKREGGDLNPRVLIGHWIFAPQGRDSNPTPCQAGPPPLRPEKADNSLKAFLGTVPASANCTLRPETLIIIIRTKN